MKRGTVQSHRSPPRRQRPAWRSTVTPGIRIHRPEQGGLGPHHRQIRRAIPTKAKRDRQISDHLAGSWTARSGRHDGSAPDNARSTPEQCSVCRSRPRRPRHPRFASRLDNHTTDWATLRLRSAFRSD
jgi:hypothetical protein